MQRYIVTIVSPGTTGQRPVLLVPFQPSSIVTAFIDELYKRVSKFGISVAPNTHIATLHMDSETGAIIDCEDVLSDVITDPKAEKLFAVFNKKEGSAPAPLASEQMSTHTVLPSSQDGAAALTVRVITPSTAKNKETCPTLRIPTSTTIRQLHERIAQQLGTQAKFEDDAEMNECNCKLANKLADGPCPETSCLVVHGKSKVERLLLDMPTEAAVMEALRRRFGADLETDKKTVLVGADVHASTPNMYKKPPVVAICSKQRHIPAHARVEVDEAGQKHSKILDLYTSEMPIHPASGDFTMEGAGLPSLATNGFLDIFAVSRTTAGKTSAAIGKSSLYRQRAHWEPDVPQSDRGMAIFLSTLRVFASVVQDMRDDQRSQDAVLHLFDILTSFPPALRTVNILINGKTPIAAESAALSHAMFEVFDSFAPTDIIGSDHTRVFELSRLFFSFVLEKSRTLKLSDEEGAKLPYLSAFLTVDVRDHMTSEPAMQAYQTSRGLVEADLFDAFQEGAVLAQNHLQAYMNERDPDATTARAALLNGGTSPEVTILGLRNLHDNYRYVDAGDIGLAVDLAELSELNHLAELCGRNKLAVHKPSQLSSAVAPCLTFDRNAHLAVYTGEQPCGDPGHSSILFRPKHGDETIDGAVVERLIAPILQRYEADGTAVFDALGGAAVRTLQAPDEILMFCVDCSASMRGVTDFEEINDDHRPVPDDSNTQAQRMVEAEFYKSLAFEDLKERLCSYEGFDDMVAIIAQADPYSRRSVTGQVLDLMKMMLSSDIINKSEDITNRRQHARGWYYVQQEIREMESQLDRQKAFWAGLKTHEASLCDFLIYRATTSTHEISQRWSWSLGDDLPVATAPQQIPTVPEDITTVPDNLRCPISHTLMTDAVTAADGHTYSHEAISHWFSIRKSSPLTGLPLSETSLNANPAVCDAVTRWVDGDGIPGRDTVGSIQPSKRQRTSSDLNIAFDSRVGSFERKISSFMKLKDLYKLAFRGLKARALTFQLVTERCGTLSPSPEATLASRGIKDGDHVLIRIAEDEPTLGAASAGVATTGQAGGQVLVKIYEGKEQIPCGFWAKRDTTQTLASILWKYWRHRFQSRSYIMPEEKQVWTDMSDSGDSLQTGHPQKSTDALASYFTRRHCFGHLGEEKVYREDGASGAGAQGNDQPMVLKVKVLPAWRPGRDRTRLTRLDVLKQMFEALINRNLAYNYKTHVGLITFDTTPRVAMGISHVLENFRRATSDMVASGDTAIWDALALANDQLIEYGKKYPEAKKRIICISDGCDTKSTSCTAPEVTWRLRQAEIAVDTVSLGNDDNQQLKTLSYLLGCYRFHPTSLVNALAICEMEPFLSLTERPDIIPPYGIPTRRLQFMGYFWDAISRTAMTIVTEDTVPARKEHPNLRDEFVQLTAVSERSNNVDGLNNTRSNLRTSRLMNEMRSIIASGTHPKYDIYVSESDMSFWKIVMDGPDDSPYSEGTFLLYLHADEGYPTFAPKVRFITKIKHPNINAHGRLCHAIMSRDWTSDLSMTTLLETVYGVLYQPEHSDPVNTSTTLGFHHDQVEFADEVREHVSRFAMKSRDTWKKEFLESWANEEGDEDEDMGEDKDMDDDDGGLNEGSDADLDGEGGNDEE